MRWRRHGPTPTPANARGARASRVGGVSGVLSFRKTRPERREKSTSTSGCGYPTRTSTSGGAPGTSAREAPAFRYYPRYFFSLSLFFFTNLEEQIVKRSNPEKNAPQKIPRALPEQKREQSGQQKRAGSIAHSSSDRNLNLNARKPRIINNVLGSGEVPLGSGSPG